MKEIWEPYVTVSLYGLESLWFRVFQCLEFRAILISLVLGKMASKGCHAHWFYLVHISPNPPPATFVRLVKKKLCSSKTLLIGNPFRISSFLCRCRLNIAR